MYWFPMFLCVSLRVPWFDSYCCCCFFGFRSILSFNLFFAVHLYVDWMEQAAMCGYMDSNADYRAHWILCKQRIYAHLLCTVCIRIASINASTTVEQMKEQRRKTTYTHPWQHNAHILTQRQEKKKERRNKQNFVRSLRETERIAFVFWEWVWCDALHTSQLWSYKASALCTMHTEPIL